MAKEGTVMDKNTRICIVGGGPAGLAAASFLSRAGIDVTVFEKREKLGGVVRYAIPEFRITEEAMFTGLRELHQLLW